MSSLKSDSLVLGESGESFTVESGLAVRLTVLMSESQTSDIDTVASRPILMTS